MAPKKPTEKNYKEKTGKPRVTKTARSGLIFPVGRVQRHLREGKYAKHIGTNAAIYMASVLEYMSAEILDLAGGVSIVNKRARITPRHIMLAVNTDEELKELFTDVTIPYAGVLPFIHGELLPKSSKKNEQPESMKSSNEDEENDEEPEQEQLEETSVVDDQKEDEE